MILNRRTEAESSKQGRLCPTVKCKTAEQVYTVLSDAFISEFDEAVAIVVHLDEKLDKACVQKFAGLNESWFRKLLTILGINPIGKTYDKTQEGNLHYYSDGGFRQFEGDLYSFSGGQIPWWVGKAVERLFGINRIFTIGINHEGYPLGSVLLFERKPIDETKFPKVHALVNRSAKRLYEILQENRRSLQIPSSKDQFTRALIDNISHEIRTPLNGILGLIDLSMKGDMNEHCPDEVLFEIEDCAKQLTQTVTNLITIANLESNQIQYVRQLVTYNDLTERIHDVVEHYKRDNSKRTIYFISEPHYFKAKVDVDWKYVETIIGELIQNALKFSEDDITVRIGFHQKCFVEVTDKGIGITEEEQKVVFDHFGKLEKIDRVYRGNGLGLTIVKRIVDDLGMKLHLYSVPNQGTKITIYFPDSQK